MTAEDNSLWEEAYLRFETPEQEIRKFTRRLIQLGARSWPRDSRIVELFCGRGNGLRALENLGFSEIEGMDLSLSLAATYGGRAVVHVGDCRELPFEAGSKDVLIVQGGLHHLAVLPDDLDRTLAEAHRVLKNGGRIVLVEPWLTPFLRFVHVLLGSTLSRKLYNRLDALAVMTHYERETYEQWLASSELVLGLVGKHFTTERLQFRRGKIYFTGFPR
jgi:ubiquinone/menaquinone biosynthesis C-methylase UbiE